MQCDKQSIFRLGYVLLLQLRKLDCYKYCTFTLSDNISNKMNFRTVYLTWTINFAWWKEGVAIYLY